MTFIVGIKLSFKAALRNRFETCKFLSAHGAKRFLLSTELVTFIRITKSIPLFTCLRWVLTAKRSIS